MTLKKVLREQQDVLHERWLERVLATYPADASAFLKRDQNRFSNPVGQTLHDGLRDLLAALFAVPGKVSGAVVRAEAFGPPLTRIIKIRAIQEFEPSEAVAFVFLLKDVLREIGEKSLANDAEGRNELQRLEIEIEKMALLAFDIYCDCQRRVMQIRIDEVKRSVSGLMRRLNRQAERPAKPEDRANSKTRNVSSGGG